VQDVREAPQARGLAGVRAVESLAGPESSTLRTTYDVVDRGLVTLTLIWQALWFIGDTRLWPTNQASTVAAVFIWLAGVAWVALLLTHLFRVRWGRWWIRSADVGALLVATIAVLIETSQAPSPDWGPASTLAVLPGALGGLLFPFSVAVWWLGAAVVIESIVIFGTHSPGSATGLGAVAVLYPAYALSVGVVTVAARFALVRAARSVDVASADLIEAEQQRLVAEGVEAAVRRQERLLHATVLNTLTAILRGGIGAPSLRQRLQERCRESIEVMAQLRRRVEPTPQARSDGQWLDRDLGDLIVDLYTAGVAVRVDCDSLVTVPADVYEAVLTAAREALTNVLRHAAATTVWLEAHVIDRGEGRHLRVSVRDDGVGFDAAVVSERFGLRGALIQAVAEVGGTSRVESAPGAGTTVVIEWQAPPRLTQIPPFRAASRAFALPLLISFGLFTTLIVVLTREQISQPAFALAAYVLFVAMAVLIGWWAARGEVPWWVVIVVVLVSPLIYQLQASSVLDDHGQWADWSSGAIVALFIVAAGAGPSWAWLVLLVTWLLIQGDVLHELLAAGTALIFAAALFGRTTRRNAAAVEAAREQAALADAAKALSSASVRRMHNRYGALREAEVTPLLEGIAGGWVDPDDPDTQSTAALEERFIRTIVKVDPAVDAVHALAILLAVRAHDTGVFLDVDIPEDPARRVRESALGRESLTRAIECSQPGDEARLSARMEGESYVIRLLAPICPQHRAEMLQLPVPGAVMDPSEPDMLWELRDVDGGVDDRSG